MLLNVIFEVHAYAEEKLCDEQLEPESDYGINGPDVMVPLAVKRGTTMPFSYSENTTVGELLEAIKSEIWEEPDDDFIAPVKYGFLHEGERYYVENENANLRLLLKNYLDPEGTGNITACLLVSCDAGAVFERYPLRFFVPSRESGRHHEPHIHVSVAGKDCEASFRISDGKCIVGHLPGRLERLAKETILEHQDYFKKCWETKTNGLIPDINHHLKIIGY